MLDFLIIQGKVFTFVYMTLESDTLGLSVSQVSSRNHRTQISNDILFSLKMLSFTAVVHLPTGSGMFVTAVMRKLQTVYNLLSHNSGCT